jgi:hypothetical protein
MAAGGPGTGQWFHPLATAHRKLLLVNLILLQPAEGQPGPNRLEVYLWASRFVAGPADVSERFIVRR